jgi:twitching motility protein PilT
MTTRLEGILKKCVEAGASDLILKMRLPPVIRTCGILAPMKGEARLSPEELAALARSIMNEDQWSRFTAARDLDLSYEAPAIGRFRVSVFYQQGTVAMVFRVIPTEPPLIGDLNLPAVVGKLALEPRGLVLVTGTTGSGKSTTLAAMISCLNSMRNCHIITIEDPIEFIHRDRKSVINQREIGRDALNFPRALRAALRENPDVILVGEMRDLETITTAFLAAETGHLVLSTLHTADAVETIRRAIASFPMAHQSLARLRLASVLRGVISQRLLPTKEGGRMVPAVEVLVSTGRIRECIEDESRTYEIRDAIFEGHVNYQMQTFDQSILELYQKGLISYDTAYEAATNRDDFALFVRGISTREEDNWELQK